MDGSEYHPREIDVDMLRVNSDHTERMHQANLDHELDKQRLRAEARKARAMGGNTRKEVLYALFITGGIITLILSITLYGILDAAYTADNIRACADAGMQWVQNANEVMECLVKP